jgi:predicted double-glycine peptidase
MNLWLAALGALLCALAGVGLGWACSRLRSPWWTIGYFIPLALVFAFALAYHFPAVMFLPPFSWMMIGLKKFAVFGFIATLVLTTPLSRLPQKRNRIVVGVLMVLMVFAMSIWPFVAPMVDRGQLSQLTTRMDRNGVCLQTTEYTCGPASAVTALRKLGLPAEEGQLAIQSCTSEQEGTPIDMLEDALNRQYAAEGLSAQGRVFKSIDDLRSAGLTLAVVKYGFLVDHWVTVLEVTDTEVVIADPLAGLDRQSYEEFAKRWRYEGIVLHRTQSAR